MGKAGGWSIERGMTMKFIKENIYPLTFIAAGIASLAFIIYKIVHWIK
jgi:hypothetical protein